MGRNTSRRRFLQTGTLAAAGVLGGSSNATADGPETQHPGGCLTTASAGPAGRYFKERTIAP
jgi:hypothetical protein